MFKSGAHASALLVDPVFVRIDEIGIAIRIQFARVLEEGIRRQEVTRHDGRNEFTGCRAQRGIELRTEFDLTRRNHVITPALESNGAAINRTRERFSGRTTTHSSQRR